MGKKSMKSLIVLGLIFLVFFAVPVGVEGNQEPIRSFSVEPIIPSNQVDKKQTYFDLKVGPGEEQILEVKVTNQSDEKITVIVQANTAFTNTNGITEYTKNNAQFDETLKVSFSEIANINEPELILNPKEIRTVKVKVQMPKSSFEGHVLGGLYFELKPNSKENQKKQIANTYSYTIGVLLSNTGKEIPSNLLLNEVRPEQKNLRNVILATIQNTEASMVRNLSVEASVYYENEKEALLQTKKDKLRMAPNSNFDFAVSLNNKAFRAGSYRIEMKAIADGETYNWSKKFEIDDKEAKEFNSKAVNLEKDTLQPYLIAGLIIGVILLVVIIIMGVKLFSKKKKKKKKKQLKKRRKMKKNDTLKKKEKRKNQSSPQNKTTKINGRAPSPQKKKAKINGKVSSPKKNRIK